MKKKGFVSLEVVLFSGFILVLLAVLVGIFIYIYPTFTLQRDIDLLTRQAQRNGGLTNKDVSDFQNKIGNYNFVKESGKPIIIEGTTDSGKNIIGINNWNYIKRNNNEIMNITVKIPSNSEVIKRFTEKSGDYYVFKVSVMSEKL